MKLTYSILKLLIISSLLLATLFAQAQKKRGMSKWHYENFEYDATPEQETFVYSVKFPISIPFPLNYNETFLVNKNNILSSYLASFFTETIGYKYQKEVAIAYGLFQLGNFNDSYPSTQNIIDIKEQLLPYFNDTIWFEETLKAFTPIIKKSWKLLDPKTRDIYIEVFKHTQNYINTFDYIKEHQYLSENNVGFTSGKFRKAEAFIYRRIDNAQTGKGNWTQAWLIKIMKSIAKILNI